MICQCCKQELRLQRTEDDEVSRCSVCGLPYWDHGFGPTPAVSPKWVKVATDYWEQYHMIVFPGDYQILFVNHMGVSLRDCTVIEIRNWNEIIVPF